MSSLKIFTAAANCTQLGYNYVVDAEKMFKLHIEITQFSFFILWSITNLMLNVKTKQNPNLRLVYQLDVLADQICCEPQEVMLDTACSALFC